LLITTIISPAFPVADGLRGLSETVQAPVNIPNNSNMLILFMDVNFTDMI
jgi:hypothetical protein